MTNMVFTKQVLTEGDRLDAQRLAGQSWHSLSTEDTRKAIVLRHVHELLGKPDRWYVGQYLGHGAEAR